ncbi:39S ribosomal protein L53, mitochondrial-like isoform X2 [Centruroides sculpturatus]|uniref:39S ribosomal protein L53, mitochondrial-like isoform X2 n=1 Tax=Centruroides sculpturatus TaxID=218467 RepID=UPI000C6EBD36|nr:39S ribosomal protein L53, mitochondrial-like isoform X2 [Centruroides sculpturatus]
MGLGHLQNLAATIFQPSVNPVAKATHTLLKEFHLKGIKRVEVKFDPFHPNVKSIRDFVYYLSAPRIRQSNVKCAFKTSVVNDRSEPTALVTIGSRYQLSFRTFLLIKINIIKFWNAYCSYNKTVFA